MTQGTFDFSENGDTPLREVKEYFFQNVDEGLTCPCCGQFAKIYKRKLNRTMVRALSLMVRAGADQEFKHSPTVLAGHAAPSRELGKLANFGLVQELRIKREDGGRAGYWKVTPKGLSFLRGTVSVPKYALIYNDRHQGFRGDPVTIMDVAHEFRLDDLMNDR